MNRRGFLRFLGTGAAVGAVAPSEVWPFRKIFLPVENPYLPAGYAANLLKMQERLDAVQAIELEFFAHEVPDLLRLYRHPFPRPAFRVPLHVEMRNASKIVLEPADADPRSAESAVAFSKVLSSLDRDIKDCLSPDIRLR